MDKRDWGCFKRITPLNFTESVINKIYHYVYSNRSSSYFVNLIKLYSVIVGYDVNEVCDELCSLSDEKIRDENEIYRKYILSELATDN